jgi:signal transduction histidine kinase
MVNVAADPIVSANEFLVTQMLTGLALNAIEAMEKVSERYVVFHLDVVGVTAENAAMLAGSYARISLVDHGKGLSQEVKQRIFEPFFSTRGGGVGKGLGLTFPMAGEIMKKHGGLIDVRSQPDCGTVVQLYFPVTGSSE